MAETPQSSKKAQEPSRPTVLKKVLEGGTAASLALCLVTPVFCLISSPILTSALQSTSAQAAMAEDPGTTAAEPIEDGPDDNPRAKDPAEEEALEEGGALEESGGATADQGIVPDTSAPEGQGNGDTPTDEGTPADENAESTEEGAPLPVDAALDPSETVEGPPTPQEVADPEAYLEGTVPREEDLPLGPDTTHAAETGMPVGGGVSARPIAALMQTIEEQATYGDGAVALQVDEATGTVEYQQIPG